MRSRGTVLSDSALVLTDEDLRLLARIVASAVRDQPSAEVDALARRLRRERERRERLRLRHERLGNR